MTAIYFPEPELAKVLDYAEKNKTHIITTVEAFHKEPDLLYLFLNHAANRDIEVIMTPIETTDHSNLSVGKSRVGGK